MAPTSQQQQQQQQQRVEVTRAARAAVHSTLTRAKPNGSLAVHDERDVVAARADVVFIGSGVHTNDAAVAEALADAPFAAKTVVHVRDVWDRYTGGARAVLSGVLGFSGADVAVCHPAIVEPATRRVAHVYERRAEGAGYAMTAHDVELVRVLRQLGFRIFVSDDEHFDKHVSGTLPVPPAQSTNSILMVAPTAFAKNIQAAEDNYFMASGEELSDADKHTARVKLQQTVLREYSALHREMTERVGADVHLFTYEEYHDTPDAVFPNNWFSTHSEAECGECTMVLYPMKVPNRRKERRPDLVASLQSMQRYQRTIDLSSHETSAHPRFLEGTGSLVIDRVNRVAYVVLSERSDLAEASHWAKALGYELVSFTATDAQGRPIYHTNVMMAVGTRVAVVCLECIEDPSERRRVKDTLEASGHEVVDITRAQVNSFCGNVIEVEHWRGYPVLVMSTQAYDGFTPAQRETLLKHERELVHADIRTLERIGGGGVRCTIAELF